MGPIQLGNNSAPGVDSPGAVGFRGVQLKKTVVCRTG